MPIETAPDRDGDEDAIRAVLVRLSRPHAAGGDVVERAAILAEGADSAAIVEWIIAHDGEPEAASSGPASRGLHRGAEAQHRAPLRYVLPAGALV